MALAFEYHVNWAWWWLEIQTFESKFSHIIHTLAAYSKRLEGYVNSRIEAENGTQTFVFLLGEYRNDKTPRSAQFIISYIQYSLSLPDNTMIIASIELKNIFQIRFLTLSIRWEAYNIFRSHLIEEHEIHYFSRYQ